MVTQVEDKEKEIFNNVLKDAAKLVVEHKLDGLPFEIRSEEMDSIYGKYADVMDAGLFMRFLVYAKSPEGRDFFKRTIRLKLWNAGFRPKGWEE